MLPSSVTSALRGVVVDEDLELDLVAHLVGLRGRGAHDRDEDAQHERRDQHGRERREARRGVAPQRAQRLAQEEDPSLTSSRPRYMARPPRRAPRGPALQLDHAAAHLVDHLVVVGGDDHGRPGAVHAVEQLHDPDRGLGVEVAGRLVRQQQRRVVDERARQRDALLLAARQLVGIVVSLVERPTRRRISGTFALMLGARLADHLQAVGDVVVDGAVRQQLVVLEDDADVAPQLGDLLARQLRRCRARRSAPCPARGRSRAAGA